MVMVLALIPVAFVLYGLGKIIIGHMVEESGAARPWEVRSQNSVEGLPHRAKH